MKIVLVNLPWHFGLGRYRFIAKRFIPQIPLALCYIASALRRAGHSVYIVDAAIEDYSIKETAEKIYKLEPHLVAIGSTTFTHFLAEELAQVLKKISPLLWIVIGGHHISALREEVLRCSPYFDVGIYGEGEITLCKVAERLESGCDLSGVEGAIFKNKGKVYKNSARPLVPSLENFTFPARDLLLTNKYFRYKNGKKTLITGFIVSRGCPFDCIFCGCHNVYGKSVRYRCAKAVVDEIEECVMTYGIREFMSYDDNFTLNRELVMNICDEIIKRKLKINLIAGTRVDCIDREMLRSLKEAGLRELGFGVESGNQSILDKINKNITLGQIREAFQLAKSFGLVTAATAMIGHPFENRKTALDTIDFLSSINELDVAMLSIATPLPGTRLFKMAKDGEGGLQLCPPRQGQFYNRYGGSMISVNDLSPEDLVKLQRFGLLKFYLNFKRILTQYRLLGFKSFLLTGCSFLRTFFSLPQTRILNRKKNLRLTN